VRARADRRGALALVLHSHMPYVEGFGTWPFGEEWLWEAVATVYLPLLPVLEDAPVTLGLTPVLCDQLEALRDDDGASRYLRFLRDVRAPIHAEDAAGLERGGERELAVEVRRAAADYELADRHFEAVGRDLVAAFRRLAVEGPTELWTGPATHAVLPLLATDAGIRLQVQTGIASHERRFGGSRGGLWLPECAYVPGLERELAEHGVRVFCVDQTEAHGLGSLEQLEPVATAAGSVAVPIDWQAVELVWHRERGYPASHEYRDYHRRTVHDLKPWNNGGGAYRPDEALTLARAHAVDFVARCAHRLDAYAAERGRPGLLCCALDAELLGHWWYEGPAWLAAVFEEAHGRELPLVTVSEALEWVSPVERPLAPSSWGTPKDLTTWDAPAVAEMAFTARRAELQTVAAAATARERRPALARAARELLALQSSDWAFLETRALAADYPLQRVRGHAAGHDAALASLRDSAPVNERVPEPRLRNLAPDLDLAPLLAP
jgi:1,4-alpha-glucan branching enzyme